MARKTNRDKTREGMRKVPSIAPTVAIAPSDYEHIFHEGVDGGKQVVPETNRERTTTRQQPQQTRGRSKDRKRTKSESQRGGGGRGPSRQRTMTAGRAAPKPSHSFTRPRTPALPKLTHTDTRGNNDEIGRFNSGGAGLKKVPSNAPTMAIAPSDYEHIYHGGPGGGGVGGTATNASPPNTPLMSPSPPAGAAPSPSQPHHQATMTAGHYQHTLPPRTNTTAAHLTNRGVAQGFPMVAAPRNTHITATEEAIVNTQAMEHDPTGGVSHGANQFVNQYQQTVGGGAVPSPIHLQRQATFTAEGGPFMPQHHMMQGVGLPMSVPPVSGPQHHGGRMIPSPVPQTSPMMPQIGGQSYQAQQASSNLATPDGYTLLGQKPNPAFRGQALPPYIVRANNQFSRSVIARVARYLATKAQNLNEY